MQLVIGFLFIFCTSVMMKQVYMLTGVDNIERKQVAYISSCRENHDLTKSILQQQPFIRELISIYNPLYPPRTLPYFISDWDGKSTENKKINCTSNNIDNEVSQFYGLKMKDGPSTFDLRENEVFINEVLAKSMNVENPIGMTINWRTIIKGVVCDYQIQNPNSPPKLMFILLFLAMSSQDI